ncbi:MAG: hypothetical protein U0792_12290 [Gemmataceae bacterium]
MPRLVTREDAGRVQTEAGSVRGLPEDAGSEAKAWETGLLSQKPTAWMPLEVLRAESKHGAPADAKPGATLTIQKDGTLLASGSTAPIDIYTVQGIVETDKPLRRFASKRWPIRPCPQGSWPRRSRASC